MDGTARIEPPSWYYSFAALFLVIGVGAMIYSFVSGIYRIRESMVRMDVPGQMDLELKRETYTVFLEYNSIAATSRNAQVNCEVHVQPSGEKIDGKPNHAMNTYNYGSRKGVTLMEFDAVHDGMYTLDCQTTGDTANLKPTVAIGGGTSKGIRTMFIRSFVLVMVGLTVALLAFLRVSMLRLKSRNEIRERGLRPV